MARRLTTGRSVEVDGLKELDRSLKRLGKAVRREGTNQALLDGAEVIRAEAARLMPRSDVAGGTYGKGHAADHFEKVLVDDGEVHIGPERDFWYVVFSEFGTPNQPARAPFRTAADTKFLEAVRAVRDRMEVEVKKAAK